MIELREYNIQISSFRNYSTNKKKFGININPVFTEKQAEQLKQRILQGLKVLELIDNKILKIQILATNHEGNCVCNICNSIRDLEEILKESKK